MVSLKALHVTSTLMLGTVGPLFAAEQVCTHPLPKLPASIQLDDSAWVSDPQTGLMWQRCALGQTWVAPECVGEAQLLTYNQALAAMSALNQHGSQGFNDWKLPHLKELAFIAEPRCRTPRVRLDLFPNTPSGRFWSRYTRIVNDFDPHVYTMDFDIAGVALTHPDESHFVRLVRKLP